MKNTKNLQLLEEQIRSTISQKNSKLQTSEQLPNIPLTIIINALKKTEDFLIKSLSKRHYFLHECISFRK